jgi:hypothetical protein
MSRICLAAAYCPKPRVCGEVGCLRIPDPPPIERLDEPVPCLHFVGFRGEEYHSAVKVFGLPDVYHRGWDQRAQREIADGDTVVFARYHDQPPSAYNFDDSAEPDDPSTRERRKS